jgi:hypothetical protein
LRFALDTVTAVQHQRPAACSTRPQPRIDGDPVFRLIQRIGAAEGDRSKPSNFARALDIVADKAELAAVEGRNTLFRLWQP